MLGSVFYTVPLFFASTIQAPVEGNPCGHWAGLQETEGSSRRVVINIRNCDKKQEANLDLPEAGALDIPLFGFIADRGKIQFELRGDRTTTSFEGRFQDGAIEGRWREGNCEGAFHLRRQAATPLSYREIQVKFRNSDVGLAGSLFIPPKSRSSDGHPAIIFVHGAGPEPRSASRFLADLFVRHGVAALIYDKRGVGESTGNWQNASYDDLATDVLAAVRFLRSRSDIDPDRIGLMGSSQGGWIAPLAAVRDERIRFAIIKSAAGTTPEEQELTRTELQLRGQRQPEEEVRQAVELYKLMVHFARTGQRWGDFSAAMKKAEDKSWYAWGQLPRDYWFFEQIRLTFHHDPIPVIHKLTCPVLFIFGANDEYMDVKKSVEAVSAALEAGATQHAIRVFPDAGHSLRIETERSTECDFPRFAPGYLELLKSWVEKVVTD